MQARIARGIVACLLQCGHAAALSPPPSPEPLDTLIAVGDRDNPDDVRQRVRERIDNGQRTVLVGAPDVLARMQPAFVHAWPHTNTVVLDPGVALGVFGFNAHSADHRREILARWPWSNPLFSDSAGPSRREAVPAEPGRRHVQFGVLAASPAQACRNFSRNMATTLFGMAAPSQRERQAFRREVRRWCQYGNLSLHAAEPAQVTIAPFRHDSDILLSIVAEWALIRNEDSSEPWKTTYMFWTRTMGEGAGMGFTRRHGMDAWYDPASGSVQRLLDAAIHTGWGSIEWPDVVTAWPLNSSFPHVGNVHLFRCDAPVAFRPGDCPVGAMLRKLYPEDSHAGTVTVSAGENISVGGDLGISRTLSADGSSLDITFGVNLLRMASTATQAVLPLVVTRSNGDTLAYRSTWWRPDIRAIQAWVDARRHTGSLASATPLAGTLNPRHEIVWELPLQGNGGRSLPYHVVYEAGWNTCIHGTHCKAYGPHPAPALPTKARVAWADGIVLRLPTR